MRHGWRHPQPPSASQAWLHAVLGVLAVVALMAVLLLGWMIAPARGHSWYPPFCCAGNDCDVLAPGRVRALDGGGFVIDERFVVPAGEVRNSMDGRYHGCFPQPDNLKCFFAPPNGS